MTSSSELTWREKGEGGDNQREEAGRTKNGRRTVVACHGERPEVNRSELAFSSVDRSEITGREEEKGGE
jgi:hypothetical protein